MDVPAAADAPVEQIGPGRLVLVVGPSGAGKDTLIGFSRKALVDDPTIVFPRRVVTRAADETEGHDTLDEVAFAAAMQRGAFALSWHAHGLSYGVPAQVDADLMAGRTVVCNVSRGIVASARLRYRHVCVVLITAPEEVLQIRLAARERDSDGDLSARLNRVSADLHPDSVIQNVGIPDTAAALFIQAIISDAAMARIGNLS